MNQNPITQLRALSHLSWWGHFHNHVSGTDMIQTLINQCKIPSRLENTTQFPTGPWTKTQSKFPTATTCIELCSIQKNDPHSVFFRQRRAINFKPTKATKCLSVVGLSSLLHWTIPQQEALLFTYISLWRIGYWRLEVIIAHRSAFHRRSTPTSGLRRHSLIDEEETTARSAARISQSETG